MRLASLGMYDFPWLAHENDSLWRAVRTGLASGAPEVLTRGRDPLDIARDPKLLLGQTCGYPLMTMLGDAVRLVATPAYDLPGCEGGTHRSFIVVRADDPARRLADLRGRRAAINGLDSNSGMNLLRASVAPLAADGRFFGSLLVTGAHLKSVAAVAEGIADTAAIDCVTYGLAARWRPELLRHTRVLTETIATPALPFITAAATSDADLAALRDALTAALPWPGLALTGLRLFDREVYRSIVDLEHEAAARGYPALA